MAFWCSGETFRMPTSPPTMPSTSPSAEEEEEEEERGMGVTDLPWRFAVPQVNFHNTRCRYLRFGLRETVRKDTKEIRGS